MTTRVKYAAKWHNTWVYRRTYPKHLQPLLGSSLKQSLKTADAKTVTARVAALNQIYQSIIKEAEQHLSADAHAAHPDRSNTTPQEALRLSVIPPGYRRVRFLGDRSVAVLAKSYLSY